MKISVSLSEDDLRTLDEFAGAEGLQSRSAALHRAIDRLRRPTLEDDYAAAWQEWEESGDEALWSGMTADGIADAKG